jgi:DNA polymerase-3 subunit gamma/tau
VRQINEAVRYSPVSARYKVYILDEVHMLSTAAFNALLKTLEEPPPHVKVRVRHHRYPQGADHDPVALPALRPAPCRCRAAGAPPRGDLRQGGISAEPEALALIARAAEGSVRDALSLMDQGIAHAAGGVRAEDVRQMLGLADRTRIIDLFEALMRGDMAKALGELRDQYDSGADPAVVLSDLAEFTHFVTRVKVVPAVADDPRFAEAERTRGRASPAQLSMRVLSRTWQMLFKGLTEVKDAAKPLAAAEMVLVRIAYAADLPTPDEVIRDIQNGAGTPANGALAPPNGALAPPNGAVAPQNGGGAPRPSAATAVRPAARRAARLARARTGRHCAIAGHFDAARRGAADACRRGLCELIALAGRSATSPPSRRSSATCGWCASRRASWRSRSSRVRARRW